MGNALSYHDGTYQLKTGKDATILNEYVNNFFRDLPNDMAKSNKLLKKQGINSSTKNKLKKLFEKPMYARACCLQQKNIPISLPYVYPYTNKGSIKKGTKIETTYPVVEVFSKKSNLKKLCGGEDDRSAYFKYNKKAIKMFPDVFKVGSGKKYTADTTALPTLCREFIGTYNPGTKETSGIGICDQVINTRKLSDPSNELRQFYGDSIKSEKKVGYLDKDGPNFRKFSRNKNNAYPECNCTNSLYIKTPLTGDNGVKLKPWQRRAAQQLSDDRCRESYGNAYVYQTETRPIGMCVNIQKNIKALADGGSKINMKQSCKTDIKVKEEVNIDKVDDMDNEDKKKKKKKETVKKQKLKTQQKEIIKKAKDKLRKQELEKTKKEKDDEKKALEAAKKKKAVDAAAKKKADMEKAKKIATEEAKQREKVRLEKEAIVLKKKKAIEAVIKKKKEQESSKKLKNMMMIGGGISVLVVIIIIVLMSGGNKEYKKIDEEEAEEEDEE
tara:strand:+ start:1389 stop:2882 length:1494 start_codon:yes stop_codon:yes gene_type:complete